MVTAREQDSDGARGSRARLSIAYLDAFNVCADYNDELVPHLRQHANVLYITSRNAYRPELLSDRDNYYHFCRMSRGLRLRLGQHVPVAVFRVLQYFEYQWDKTRLVKFVDKKRPQVLHIQWWLFPRADEGFLRCLQRRKIAIVHTAHNVVPHGYPRPEPDEWLRRYYEAVDKIIVHCAATASELRSAVPTVSDKICIVPFGVFWSNEPEKGRAESRALLGWSETEKVFVFFGTVSRYKGVDILLRAFAGLESQHPVRLVIAGKWEFPVAEIAGLVSDVRKRHRVDLHLGFVPRAAAAAMLCGCDATVLPYRHATMSAAAMAALRFSAPMIATKTGGLPDVVGSFGRRLLAQPGDPASLRWSLAEFLNMGVMVPVWKEELRRLAREEFSWQGVAARTVEIYKELACGGTL